MSTALAPYRNSFIQAMEDAQQQIYNRLAKIADILADINAEYAVVGGNAVIAWMRAKHMDSRTTRDVVLMLRKKDLPAIRSALEKQGYEFIKTGGMSLFFDTTEGVERKVQNGIHLVFSGEKIKNSITPELAYTEFGGLKVATIENLVKMKTAAARPKDLEHLQDLIEAGYTTKAKVLELARGMNHTAEQKTVLSLLKEKSQDNDDLPALKSPKASKTTSLAKRRDELRAAKKTAPKKPKDSDLGR
jgi:hypothetical protein